MRRHRKYIRFT